MPYLITIYDQDGPYTNSITIKTIKNVCITHLFKFICNIFFFLVIVEEGTETLEPYLVASLTEHVQHLILIGKTLKLHLTNIFLFIEK